MVGPEAGLHCHGPCPKTYPPSHFCFFLHRSDQVWGQADERGVPSTCSITCQLSASFPVCPWQVRGIRCVCVYENKMAYVVVLFSCCVQAIRNSHVGCHAVGSQVSFPITSCQPKKAQGKGNLYNRPLLSLSYLLLITDTYQSVVLQSILQ